MNVHYKGAVQQSLDFGEAYNDKPAIHVINYPDDRKGQPGHYDLLIEKRTDTMRNFPVYKVRDFVAVETGPFTWQMAQETSGKIDIGKVEVIFMSRNGSKFSSNQEKLQVIGAGAVIHRCDVRSINDKLQYSFTQNDLRKIRGLMNINEDKS